MDATQFKRISIAQLNPAKYNPRIDLKPGDTEYEKLKRSILEFGLVEPIVWNKRRGNVVGGHQRLKVLEELGEKEIDCLVVDLDDLREKTLNLALNKISGRWDEDLLAQLLEELSNIEADLDLTGFSLDEMETFIGADPLECKGDDYDLTASIQKIKESDAKVQEGEVWKLGSHRMMCGDSTSASDIAKLMGDDRASLILTDPPYNVAYQGQHGMQIENDDLPADEFATFLNAAFQRMHEVCNAGAPIYVFHSDGERVAFQQAMESAKFMVKECLIWVKNHFVLGRQDYQWKHEPVLSGKHEPILYGWQEGSKHYWNGGRKQATVIEWDRPIANNEHPTMKPVGLCAVFIRNSSQMQGIVLDPFGGSGSTLLACDQMGRVCYTMEHSPVYCEVILDRWEN